MAMTVQDSIIAGAILLVLAGIALLTGQPSQSSSQCHIRGVLPDPICTPGAVNPKVTQANIQRTICVKGWTATVRPPTSYTQKVEKLQITSYGYKDTNSIDYITDHALSLELGGNATNPVNLWPELTALSKQDDQVENRLHSEVCEGKNALIDAQRQELELKYNHGYRTNLSNIKL
jgi:hypothetical protein